MDLTDSENRMLLCSSVHPKAFLSDKINKLKCTSSTGSHICPKDHIFESKWMNCMGIGLVFGLGSYPISHNCMCKVWPALERKSV